MFQHVIEADQVETRPEPPNDPVKSSLMRRDTEDLSYLIDLCTGIQRFDVPPEAQRACEESSTARSDIEQPPRRQTWLGMGWKG